MTFGPTGDNRFDLASYDQTIRGLISAGGTNQRRVFNSVAATTSVLTVGNGNGTHTFNGTIVNNIGTGGTIAFTKVGTGTQTLAGTVDNTYTGATTINGGILALSKTDEIDAIAGNITIGDGATTPGNDILRLDASNQIANTAVISFNAATGTNSGIFRLNGFSESVAGISSTGGGGIIENESSTANGTLAVTTAASQTFSGILRNGDGVGTDGTLALAKFGGSVLTLSGANSYSGTTNIANGTLSLANVAALGSTSAITIGGTQAATLASALDGITITAPITTANTGVNSNISFGRATSAVGSLTLNGAIGGAGNVVFTTPVNDSGNNVQTINLGAAGTWAGSTTMTAGATGNTTLVKNTSGAANVLPTGTVLTLSGGAGAGSGRTVTFDLNGQDQTLAGLTNTTAADRNQRVTSATAATLTINDSGTRTFGNFTTGGDPGNGRIEGAIALTKAGAGTFTLIGSHTYTGATTVTGGTLKLGANNVIPDVSNVTIGTATLDADSGTDTAGTLDVTGSAVIDLGSGAALAFADSESVDWTGGTLNITGTLGTTSLRFGDTLSQPGLLPAQLAVISVNGSGLGTYILDADGYLIPGGGGTPYDTWATDKGLTGGPGSSTDPAKSADPDKDGQNNLQEFAFDGDPLSGADDGKVVGKIATVGADQVLTLTLPVRTGASFPPVSGDQLSALIDGIIYRIEGDVDLSTFADDITEVTGGDATTIQTGLPGLSTGWTYRTFRAPGTVPTVPKAFLRAKISETP